MSCLRKISNQAMVVSFSNDGPNCIDVDTEFIGDLLISHSMIMMVNYHFPNFFRLLLCLHHGENLWIFQPEISMFIESTCEPFKVLVSMCSGMLWLVGKTLHIHNLNRIQLVLICFIHILECTQNFWMLLICWISQ